MLDLSILPLFLSAVFFLVIAPGPDLVLISSYSSTKGIQSGIAISLGIFIAGLIQTALVAFGLGQLMQTLPWVAWAVKIVGACYLAYIGTTLLYQWYCAKDAIQPGKKQCEETPLLSLVVKGCLNNLLNPKALLFFSLFLPQFTTHSSPLVLQILILGLLLSGIALFANLIFSFIFSYLAKKISPKPSLVKHIDAMLGVLFLGLAARLITTKSSV